MKNKLEVVYMDIDGLIPYDKNPRYNEDSVDYVANSIKEFGFKVPIVIDKNNVVVAGHTRLLASKKLGLKEVPVIIADDLTEDQIKAYRLADNKVSELSVWNLDLLSQELNDIELNMDQFGFLNMDFSGLDDIVGIAQSGEDENPYTTKINIPQYEIKGEEPAIEELVNVEKANQLIEEIKNADITEEQKDFLIKASQRHLGFNYSKIAEYYAHQDKKMQELMEKSALVIIDYKDAIKNGYAELIKGIEDITEDDEYDEYEE